MHPPHPSPAAEWLRGRIARDGPISFADFMQAALYHPEHGYYTRLRGFGPHGDFITSPETHPLFGALIARQVVEAWSALGAPRPVRLLEYGGGSGALAHTILEALPLERPDLAEALHYTVHEPSPSLQDLQQQTLADHGARWGLPTEPQHLVLANEVLDAAPVHRVVVRNGTLRELRVGLTPSRDRESFEWVEMESVPPAIERYFDQLNLRPPEGAIAEVNLGLPAWVHHLAARMAPEGSLALILDYGYPAADLFARPHGTLLTYYRHTLGSDPLVRVGEQDISAHVDFTTLATAAQQAGLHVLGLTTQRALLHNLGWHQYARRLHDGSTDAQAIGTLVAPDGLGRIKALFLARGLPDYTPVGLHRPEGATWPEPAWLPTLTPEPPPPDFLDLWHEAFGDGDEEPEPDS